MTWGPFLLDTSVYPTLHRLSFCLFSTSVVRFSEAEDYECQEHHLCEEACCHSNPAVGLLSGLKSPTRSTESAHGGSSIASWALLFCS